MVKEKNKTIKEAAEEIRYLTGDDADRRMEELEEKWAIERMITEHYMKEIGKAEGKTEEKIEIAKNMLERQIDIEIIAEVTGLAVDEIKKINCKN